MRKPMTKLSLPTLACCSAASPLGVVWIVGSAHGVHAIAFGDDAQTLPTDLRQHFPHASICPHDARLNDWLQQVLGVIESPARTPSLPLCISGTVWQQRVWALLRTIPAGKTLSYSEIARRLGQLRGARAVGQACGANWLALVIPCHRVVAADGSLGGYRWGLPRKRALLAHERVTAS